MDSLLKRIQRVRSAAFCARDLFLLHDNAPAHKAASVCQFLNQKNKLTTFYQPSHFPDLSLPDHFLSKLKVKLEILHFADVTEIQKP